MIRPETSARPGRFQDRDFDAADRLDALIGFSAVADERRQHLVAVVHMLAEADRVVEEVRRAMLGPYGALFRLAMLNLRCSRAVARVSVLNDELNGMLDQVARIPGTGRAIEILRDRLGLHLEAEAELVAGLSPGRRKIVDDLRARRTAV